MFHRSILMRTTSFLPQIHHPPKFLISPILLNCLSSLCKTNQSTVYWRFYLSHYSINSPVQLFFNVFQNHQFLPLLWNSPISVPIGSNIFHLNKKLVFSVAHTALQLLLRLFCPLPRRCLHFVSTFLPPILLRIHSSKPFTPP